MVFQLELMSSNSVDSRGSCFLMSSPRKMFWRGGEGEEGRREKRREGRKRGEEEREKERRERRGGERGGEKGGGDGKRARVREGKR